MNLPVQYIKKDKPKLGNKMICIQEHGMFVLEEIPCSLRCIINTRIGSGSLSIYNGLPDKNGRLQDDAELIINASPLILGSWNPDAGCDKGLTVVIHSSNGVNNLPPCLSISWQPHVEMQRKIENV